MGEPVVRVAWLHEATAEDLDALAREQIDSVPDVPVQQSRIEVDGREATMLAPMPGEVVNTLIYVPVDDRLYTLLFFKEQLDDEDHCLLDSVRFGTPTQSLSSLDLTPSADARPAPPAVETAFFATATAAAQATPDAIVTAAPPDTSAEWTRHDFVEWGLSLSLPGDWEKERRPGAIFFKSPGEDTAQLTVGLQGDLPDDLAVLADALEAHWNILTTLAFTITPTTVDDTEGLMVWNTSPHVCAHIYIPAHEVVRNISLGALFCNESGDALNEAGQKLVDSIDVYAP